MAQYQGRVSKLFTSRFGGSFGLEGQHGLYFNTKNPLPNDVQEGVMVSFDGQMGRNGKSFQVNDASLKVLAAAAPQAASQGPSNTSSRDDSIRYQSSRKDAIAVVTLLVTSGALKLPEAQAKKAGVIEDAVDRFTAVYFEDIETLGALDRVPVPEAPKATAAAEQMPE